MPLPISNVRLILTPRRGTRSPPVSILLRAHFFTTTTRKYFNDPTPYRNRSNSTTSKCTAYPLFLRKLSCRLFSSDICRRQVGPGNTQTLSRTDVLEESRAFRRRLRHDSGEEETVKDVRLGDVARLFGLAKREVWSLTGAFLLLCVSSTVALCVPYSIGKILDLAVKKDGDRRLFGLTLTQFNVGLGSLFILGASAYFGRVYILRVVGERIVARLRSKLYKQTVTQDAEFFDANRVGDLLSRFSSDANLVAKSLTQNIADGLKAAITGTAGLVMMAYVSLELTGILVSFVPPVVVGAYYYGRRIRDITTQSQRTLGTATRVAEETLNHIKTVQAFSADVAEVRKYNKEIRHIYEIGQREALLSASFFSATNLAGNMTILTLLSVGTQMVLDGSISMGDLSSFMMYSAYTGSAMISLSSFYSKMMKGLGAASRVFELEDSKRVVRSTIGIPVTHDTKGPIEFKNVKFSYPTRPSSLIFNDLSFIIPPGSNICVVGPSGGGKTTISQLLLRFYDPIEGTITLNGKDIRIFNLASLRRAIGLVGQEPVLFSGSIADNIAYGKPSASRKEIENAARQANCLFISDFPQGLDTQVGPRGDQLSGGQKQRIAIARALIRNPSILILDEATSSLDAESEAAVTDALRHVMDSDCTTISISHRLSAIRRSDHVVVLDTHGCVVEQGRFQDLVANENSYFMKVLT
ncbi:P-loop containing nucleoside triphosphate hydrolase protein [Lipomyces kononenkoae]|uniref:P-loop containing nucleoside triphosphate hydrolase protein n=1 Tax=Lipomyces kononenkoae TaxID=34357 RepID=A0ACC3T1X9_LIPKO